MTKYGASSASGRCSHVLSCLQRFPGPLAAKKWKIFEKMQILWFFGPFSQRSRSLQSARIWSMSSILVLFGPLVGHWYMQSCFPMFVSVFQAIRGVKNDLDQKMSFLGVHRLMKWGQKGAYQGEPLGINFFGLSMHFSHQLDKRNGKINWPGSFD